MAASSSPDAMESHNLSPGDANRLWNWVLVRQGLAAHTRRASVEEIAEAALGLHAARLPSPFTTVAARAVDPAVALSLFAPITRRRLVTLRCMRKTLHTLPLGLASAAHAATLHFRERDALRMLLNAGLNERSIAGVTRALVELLGASGPLYHRDIENRLAGAAIPVRMTRLALKLAWERGILVYANHASGWNREVRTFALGAHAYPGLERLPSDTAVERLMVAYLDRYGPVSVRDATWWSGLSRAAVLAGWDRARVKLVELHTPWATSPLYMPAERFAEFTNASEIDCAASISLLAHEDVALKAYFETRGRYLGELTPSAVFNQIGEVLPTIIIDGRVVGVWTWDQHVAQVCLRIVPGMVRAGRCKEVEAVAARLATTLAAGRALGPRVDPDQVDSCRRGIAHSPEGRSRPVLA